jgi:HD-GYP domain-containing protein (c-di-GMP phosphodiesterase class II)
LNSHAIIRRQQSAEAVVQLDELGMAGLLHDFGMVKVPDEILNKPDRLSPIELAIVRRHVNWGAEMLDNSPGIPATVIEAARNHHERFDGSGYPDGLSGPQIPIGSRIILACDAYAAMTTARPNRRAMAREDAIGELRARSGTQFDPEVVDALLDLLGA